MKEHKISADEAKALWNSIFEYGGFEDELYLGILEEHGLIEIDGDTGDVVGDECPTADDLLNIIVAAMTSESISGE